MSIGAGAHGKILSRLIFSTRRPAAAPYQQDGQTTELIEFLGVNVPSSSYERPAFAGRRYAAILCRANPTVMAIGRQVWQELSNLSWFADRCATTA